MKKFIKVLFIIVLAFSVSAFSAVIYFDNSLGDVYCVKAGEEPVLGNSDILKCRQNLKSVSEVSKLGSNLSTYDMTLSFLGIVPVKTVHVTETDETKVVVLGEPFGIKVYTEGVMVVGFNDVTTHSGTYNPALNAGLKLGDMILEINGVKMGENTDVQSAVLKSNGKEMSFLIKRDDNTFNVTVKPAKSSLDNKWKTGMWVRDSSAGIGTLTFYSPTLDVTAGLGHGICDADTDKLLPLESGEFVEADIVGLKKATNEVTGELQGIFSGDEFAEFKANDITGVYGTNCESPEGGKLLPVALKQEVKTGKATIITTLDSEGPKEYECEIEKIYHSDNSKIKNMVIKVTDPKLLKQTGGIVQGMSGSPVIQNGKLIGAVTHVFVDDCKKGYAIFAENMLDTAQSVAENNKIKEAS